MKRFSLNKIRKSIWFGIGFGMTAYFMAGCSDNDSSEYIELAAKITLTQSEYYNNEGETTLHPWTKDDKAGIFVIRDNFLQKINISPIQTQSPKSLFLLNFKAPKHSNATLVAFYPADANLIYEDDILKTTIPTTQTGTVAPLLIGQTTGRIDSYEGLHMELKHLFNTMYIPVWGSHAIAKAVIQANGGEAIAGETSIRLKDGVICASEKSVTVKFSTPLDCSAEIKLIPVMLAPVTLSQGYSVTIYDINGISYTVSSDKPITLTAGGKADADEARSPYVIETISFNIRVDNPSDGDNIWKNRKQAVITMINRQQPTIMGLQEAQPHQITYLAKQCPEYAWYGLGRDTGEAPPKTETSASEECMAIFFQTSIVEMLDKGTFWLSETPNIPSKGWDANYNRSCTWALFRQKTTGKRFYFFNTHLDNSGTVARKESIKLIINKIEEVNSEQLPVFLTADFNSDTDESCFNPLHQVMKDARATAPVTDQEATYNGYKTSGTRKLDHIFYDNGCVASIFQTLKENYGAPYISDHYPVRTCFVLF